MAKLVGFCCCVTKLMERSFVCKSSTPFKVQNSKMFVGPTIWFTGEHNTQEPTHAHKPPQDIQEASGGPRHRLDGRLSKTTTMEVAGG